MLWIAGDTSAGVLDNPESRSRPVGSLWNLWTTRWNRISDLSGLNGPPSTIHRPYYYDYREFQEL